MLIWVLRDCEIEHERYQAGQTLDVSDALGTHLRRCSPESFTDVDPAAAKVKALDAPPHDKMVRSAKTK